MTTLNTVIKEENGDKTADNDSQLDENEILSSTRIKQRRATVAPTAVPTTQLPRYLRDPGRYGNRTRRQSMPAQYISQQPLPTIHLTSETNSLDLSETHEELDKSSKEKARNTRTQSPKTPLTNCSSFPLDHRLQNGQKLNGLSSKSTQEINSSSEGAAITPPKSSRFVFPPRGVDNKGVIDSELELTISRTPTPKFLYNDQRTLAPATHSDKIRRHSIAVSVIADSNRIRSEGPLPGMTDLGDFERSLCKSRDRIISVPSGDGSESDRNPADRKMSRHYVPKPDNHLLLSIFSCLCCCPIIGLVAVIFSVQVDQKYEKGKKEESVAKSKNARYWALSAVAIGMMVIIGASMYGVIVFAAV